jgi:hypothetical protein
LATSQNIRRFRQASKQLCLSQTTVQQNKQQSSSPTLRLLNNFFCFDFTSSSLWKLTSELLVEMPTLCGSPTSLYISIGASLILAYLYQISHVFVKGNVIEFQEIF